MRLEVEGGYVKGKIPFSSLHFMEEPLELALTFVQTRGALSQRRSRERTSQFSGPAAGGSDLCGRGTDLVYVQLIAVHVSSRPVVGACWVSDLFFTLLRSATNTNAQLSLHSFLKSLQTLILPLILYNILHISWFMIRRNTSTLKRSRMRRDNQMLWYSTRMTLTWLIANIPCIKMVHNNNHGTSGVTTTWFAWLLATTGGCWWKIFRKEYGKIHS